jgi:hypothetical protein
MEVASLRSELAQLQSENTGLRNTLLALHSELYGAKLAAKYLDKELAGRWLLVLPTYSRNLIMWTNWGFQLSG